MNAWRAGCPGSLLGVSKIKILWYNKGYEKENGRGMEKMPEMRKD